LLGIVLATVVLHERLPPRRAAGAAVIVLGLVVIGGEAVTTIGVHGVAGDQLFVLAGSFFATFGMFLRKWRVPPTRAMVAVSVVSLAILPLYWALAGFGRIAALGLWENLLQAVLQGLLAGPGAIYLFTRSVVLLGASRAAVFPTLVPPCVLLIGWIALGVVPSLLQFVGLAVVLLGFRLTQRA
jgi:drug/metabolite transporter (DMT)-like permease